MHVEPSGLHIGTIRIAAKQKKTNKQTFDEKIFLTTVRLPLHLRDSTTVR